MCFYKKSSFKKNKFNSKRNINFIFLIIKKNNKKNIKKLTKKGQL